MTNTTTRNNCWLWLRDMGVIINVASAVTYTAHSWQRADRIVRDGSYIEVGGWRFGKYVPDICVAQNHHDTVELTRIYNLLNRLLSDDSWEDSVYNAANRFVNCDGFYEF